MNIDLPLFKNIMAEARNNPDLLDSFSPNQFKSKDMLIKMIDNLNVINSNSEIVIFGSWYGSILIPAFKDVKKITPIDIDEKVINIAKNRLFNHYTNINFRNHDIFNGVKLDLYRETNLFINTSCEHMLPMKDWPLWEWTLKRKHNDSNPHFVFQSNDMYDIEGHINCVSSIEEFKYQLPKQAKVLHEKEIKDTRGTRFTLVGKLCN
jgi:hypothetical protein